jgi:hypothetical protein
MLRRRLFATATIIAMSAGLAATASAATQEYQFTVPVSIKISPKSVKTASLNVGSATGAGVGKQGTGLPVTVTCAIGAASIALAGGQAVNASGTGSATAQLQRGVGTNVFAGNVPVTITAPDATKPATTYLCWTAVSSTVLAPSVQTPVNFITGKVDPGTASTGTTGLPTGSWDLVTNGKS